MVIVEDILTDSLALCIQEWFEPTLHHPFLDLQITVVPDSVKPIPKRWVDDVEVDLLGAEEGDVLGEGPQTSWSGEDARRRLCDALARLDLSEKTVSQASLSKMNRYELAAEKRRVKQELKRYDSEFRKQFTRMPTHMEKEPMRPLYVYYRRLKTAISQAEHSRGGRRSNNGPGSDDEGPALKFGPRATLHTIPDDENPYLQSDGKQANKVAAQIAELEARVESLQSEKSSIRAKLQSFQERFVVENNRKIRFHKDILPIEREYRAYKNVKEDIMKAEDQLRDLKMERES